MNVLQISVYIPYGNTLKFVSLKEQPTYVTFLDASKAFDRLNHWTLFDKLLLRGVPKFCIRILCYWYVKQNMCIAYNGEAVFLENFM